MLFKSSAQYALHHSVTAQSQEAAERERLFNGHEEGRLGTQVERQRRWADVLNFVIHLHASPQPVILLFIKCRYELLDKKEPPLPIKTSMEEDKRHVEIC